MPKHDEEDFWTDEQWAILAPLEESERFKLAIAAAISGRGLIGEHQWQQGIRKLRAAEHGGDSD